MTSSSSDDDDPVTPGRHSAPRTHYSELEGTSRVALHTGQYNIVTCRLPGVTTLMGNYSRWYVHVVRTRGYLVLIHVDLWILDLFFHPREKVGRN